MHKIRKTTAKAVVFAVLKGKVVLFIFAEVQSFGLRRDAPEGVIAEFPAVVTDRDDSLLGTEHHFLIHFRAEPAVEAGALHFFTKQHLDPFLSRPLYTMNKGISSVIFTKRRTGISSKAEGPTCR